MKKLPSALFALGFSALAFTTTSQASTNAGGAQGATQAGPLVHCLLPGNETDYLPTMMCHYYGGSFTR